MTRRDQTLRAWIELESPRHCWQSMISHKGKLHIKSTGSRIRKAALEFNHLHVLALLTGKPSPANHSSHQSTLFP